MNDEFSFSKWSEIKELIKMNWDLIDEDEIDSIRGQLDLLSEKIQKTYNYTKERADYELHEFKKELNPKNTQSFYLPNRNFLY